MFKSFEREHIFKKSTSNIKIFPHMFIFLVQNHLQLEQKINNMN